MRHDIAAKVGVDRMAELLPPYPVNGLSIVGSSPSSESGANSGVVRPFRSAAAGSHYSSSLTASVSAGSPFVRDLLLGGTFEALGSNNWVVDGTLTTSGKPLLANDPHLGTHVPSLWYLAHMTAGDFDVIGATLPGAPAVAIGRNRSIAWGETNVAADVEDLYLEHVDASGKNAEFRGAQEPMRIIPETIAVKGAPPIRVDVRVTRHGPLVSDALNAISAAAKTEPKPLTYEPLAFPNRARASLTRARRDVDTVRLSNRG